MYTKHWYYCNLVDDKEASPVVPIVQKKRQNGSLLTVKASMGKAAVLVLEVDDELAVRRSTFVLAAESVASMKSRVTKAERGTKNTKEREAVEMASVQAVVPVGIDTNITSADTIVAEPARFDKRGDDVGTGGGAEVETAQETIETVRVVDKIDTAATTWTGPEEERDVQTCSESIDIVQVVGERDEEMEHAILEQNDDVVGTLESEKAEAVAIAHKSVEIVAVGEKNEAGVTQNFAATQEEQSAVEIVNESVNIDQVAVSVGADAQMDDEILEGKEVVRTLEFASKEEVKTVHEAVEVATAIEENIDVAINSVRCYEESAGRSVNEKAGTNKVIDESHEPVDHTTRTNETVGTLESSSSEAAKGEESETETQSEISEVPAVDVVEPSKLNEESESEVDETMMINPMIAAKENGVGKAQAPWFNFIPAPVRHNGYAVSSVGVAVATVIAAALIARR
ncbi:hypothetical protein PsorP6_005963 [Peronosclerospora sorghi]|uniref:Uncharacterized protein n=1 Tax=Peronosclerospora sorghi TaxID=230839 RepID=A0ACC0W852_9STRA|nr:hypothetical protein PsorP6_005963 [Peronosclerospora sorghi]